LPRVKITKDLELKNVIILNTSINLSSKRTKNG
jgi:hypothetical protein